jgi:hypothetical protein
MKVSKDQIEDLYAFTIKHYVEYYDLQTELVDHMANDIEDIWKTEPGLTYFEARHKAFKKFGVYGFMEVVEHRQKAMNIRYLRLLWKELIHWFGIPKLAISLSLGISFYLILSSSVAQYFFVAFYISILIFGFYKTIQLRRQFRRRKEKSNKKWLLEDLIFKQFSGIAIVFLSQLYNVFNLSDKFFTNQTLIVITSVVLTLACLIMYISFELIPNKANDILKKTYPEFSL